MKFKIILNKHYLLIHALRQSDLPFPEWEKLQNKLWEKYPRAFNLLTFHSESAFIGSNPMDTFTSICNKEVELMITLAFKSKEFKRLYMETKKYLQLFKKQWQENGKAALTLLEDLSGLKLPNKQIEVVVTYPKLYRSFALPQYDFVSLGYADDWPNSSVVYLCHEIMHLVTTNTRIMHALIKLMADNEIRIRLNKKGEYFIPQNFSKKKERSYTYFAEIGKWEKKIMPFWKEYLKRKERGNIIDLEKEIIRKLKLK